MVVIRLARSGAKKRPFYHVVATDSRSARDGRYIERIGTYNPVANGQETMLTLDMERVNYWTSNGAQLSDKAAWLIKQFKKNDSQAIPALTPEQKEAKRKAKADAKAAKAAAEKAAEATEEEAPAAEEGKAEE